MRLLPASWHMPTCSAVHAVGQDNLCAYLAKTINCPSPTADGEACNQCESCLAFNEQRSYNIHELDAASNQLRRRHPFADRAVRIPPQIGKYKVYHWRGTCWVPSCLQCFFWRPWKSLPHHAIFILLLPKSIRYCLLSRAVAKSMISTASALKIPQSTCNMWQSRNISMPNPKRWPSLPKKADGGMTRFPSLTR